MKLKLNKKDIKADRGITLIALVITIIVLLILAGITVVTLTGDNGILTKVGDARNRNTDAEIEEEIRLAWNKVYLDDAINNYTPEQKASALEAELERNKSGETATVSANGSKLNVNYRGKDKVLDVSTGTVKGLSAVAKAKSAGTVFSDKNTPLTDEDGNTVVIPKGFKISSDSAEVVTEGIVIEDATYENTIGSEFVWIPVSKDSTDANKVKGAKGNKTIILGRYVFDSSGNVDTTLSKSNPQDQLKTNSSRSYYFTEGLKNSTTSNAHARDIEDFITKTNAAGGFWIGRYEARIEGYTSVNTSCPYNDPNWVGYTGGKLVEKPEAQVFNYITQNKASELSRTMYSANNYFESDLINSYAWDTATLFLQEYDNRTYNINTNSNYKAKYSNQTRLSTGLKNTGTNASNITDANKDKICNVYDMADNCMEWSTETSSYSGCPCVERGGSYLYSNSCTSSRCTTTPTYAGSYDSFRSLLYVMQN